MTINLNNKMNIIYLKNYIYSLNIYLMNWIYLVNMIYLSYFLVILGFEMPLCPYHTPNKLCVCPYCLNTYSIEYIIYTIINIHKKGIWVDIKHYIHKHFIEIISHIYTLENFFFFIFCDSMPQNNVKFNDFR